MKNPKLSIVIINKTEQSLNEFVNSLENQIFKDFEAIFVNCLNINNPENNLLLEKDKRFIQVSLSEEKKIDYAKKIGLDLATGDYICFLENLDILPNDFFQNLYYENIKQQRNYIEFKDKTIYKREFIVNNKDIENIIEQRVNIEVQKIQKQLKQYEDIISERLNECYKNSDNNIDNKMYNVNTRFNALEKFVYDKEQKIEEVVKNELNNVLNNVQSNNAQIYNDIAKEHDYINSEINKKGNEINNVYDEITRNYKYTEKLQEEVKKYLDNGIISIYKRIENIEKEQEIKYSSLQKQINTALEEIKYKMDAITIIANSNDENYSERLKEVLKIEDTLKINIDKIYSFINENNSKFYEELSLLYKDLNEKIINKLGK